MIKLTFSKRDNSLILFTCMSKAIKYAKRISEGGQFWPLMQVVLNNKGGKTLK